MMAAECHGFAAAWGGCQICGWTRMWISQHVLPSSLTGCHAKVYLLLDDPEIAMELHTYIHSNKWVMDAPRLTDFSKNRLVPMEAEKYLHSIVQNEMLQGLKCYMELDLFPVSTLKLERGSHWPQHGNGYIMKGFSILYTRKACTLMAMIIQMLSNIIKTSFCQG